MVRSSITIRTSFSVAGKLFFSLLAAILATACSSGPEFRIAGTVDGLGTQNLTIVYYADNAVQQVSAPAIDSRFTMTGRTDRPTLAWIYNNTGSLIGRLIVAGGDNIEAKFSLANPYESSVKGSDDSELLARFIRENAEILNRTDATASTSTSHHKAGTSMATPADLKALNSAVESFVKKNNKSIAAAAVMAEFFNPAVSTPGAALQLLELIPPSYRPNSFTRPFATLIAETELPDSILTPQYSPLRAGIRVFSRHKNSADTILASGSEYTLLLFTTDNSRRSDSVSGLVESFTNNTRIRIADLSADKDTIVWNRSLPSRGSRDIERYWLPGGPATPGLNVLNVSADPFFIVADSTARIIYRGTSAKGARSTLSRLQ